MQKKRVHIYHSSLISLFIVFLMVLSPAAAVADSADSSEPGFFGAFLSSFKNIFLAKSFSSNFGGLKELTGKVGYDIPVLKGEKFDVSLGSYDDKCGSYGGYEEIDSTSNDPSRMVDDNMGTEWLSCRYAPDRNQFVGDKQQKPFFYFTYTKPYKITGIKIFTIDDNFDNLPKRIILYGKTLDGTWENLLPGVGVMDTADKAFISFITDDIDGGCHHSLHDEGGKEIGVCTFNNFYGNYYSEIQMMIDTLNNNNVRISEIEFYGEPFVKPIEVKVTPNPVPQEGTITFTNNYGTSLSNLAGVIYTIDNIMVMEIPALDKSLTLLSWINPGEYKIKSKEGRDIGGKFTVRKKPTTTTPSGTPTSLTACKLDIDCLKGYVCSGSSCIKDLTKHGDKSYCLDGSQCLSGKCENNGCVGPISGTAAGGTPGTPVQPGFTPPTIKFNSLTPSGLAKIDITIGSGLKQTGEIVNAATGQTSNFDFCDAQKCDSTSTKTPQEIIQSQYLSNGKYKIRYWSSDPAHQEPQLTDEFEVKKETGPKSCAAHKDCGGVRGIGGSARNEVCYGGKCQLAAPIAQQENKPNKCGVTSVSHWFWFSADNKKEYLEDVPCLNFRSGHLNKALAISMDSCSDMNEYCVLAGYKAPCSAGNYRTVDEFLKASPCPAGQEPVEWSSKSDGCREFRCKEKAPVVQETKQGEAFAGVSLTIPVSAKINSNIEIASKIDLTRALQGMHHKLEAYYSGTYFGETTINCPDKEGGYICKQPGTAILNIGANWPAGSYTIKLFNLVDSKWYDGGSFNVVAAMGIPPTTTPPTGGLYMLSNDVVKGDYAKLHLDKIDPMAGYYIEDSPGNKYPWSTSPAGRPPAEIWFRTSDASLGGTYYVTKEDLGTGKATPKIASFRVVAAGAGSKSCLADEECPSTTFCNKGYCVNPPCPRGYTGLYYRFCAGSGGYALDSQNCLRFDSGGKPLCDCADQQPYCANPTTTTPATTSCSNHEACGKQSNKGCSNSLCKSFSAIMEHTGGSSNKCSGDAFIMHWFMDSDGIEKYYTMPCSSFADGFGWPDDVQCSAGKCGAKTTTPPTTASCSNHEACGKQSNKGCVNSKCTAFNAIIEPADGRDNECYSGNANYITHWFASSDIAPGYYTIPCSSFTDSFNWPDAVQCKAGVCSAKAAVLPDQIAVKVGSQNVDPTASRSNPVDLGSENYVSVNIGNTVANHMSDKAKVYFKAENSNKWVILRKYKTTGELAAQGERPYYEISLCTAAENKIYASKNNQRTRVVCKSGVDNFKIHVPADKGQYYILLMQYRTDPNGVDYASEYPMRYMLKRM